MGSYNEFINNNIAPYNATKIGVYNSSNVKVGEIPVTNLKPDFGERLYRFGLLSDVHNQQDQTAESTEDLQRALAFFNEKESVSFTCICGDISQSGTAAEFQIYKTNVETKSPNTPVYTTTGNHDCGQGTSGLTLSDWNQYTGNHGQCFEITQGTDHFLFFGMNKWSFGSSGTPYLDESITWISNKLEEYRNERCFVFTHLFFPDRAGNLNSIYPSGNWLGGTQLTTIQALNDRYQNAIWFSGHSHWKWNLQKYQDRANIYKNNCGWCVHVPSCAIPIDSDGTTRVEKPLESEGAIVDVYENYIDIRGMDLKNQKYLPIAQYRLDTTLVEIPEKGALTYTWELGSWGSSQGEDRDYGLTTYNSIRTGYIEVDTTKSLLLTLIDPIEQSDDDTSLKEISIGMYNSSKTFLGRATFSDGTYYFKPACENLDISSYVFTSTNVKYIRVKAYRNSSTKAITINYGARIILKQQ